MADEWRQVSGGSAANTAVGVASLGGSPAYLGSVGVDELGAGYDLELASVGVRCVLATGHTGAATGQCLAFVTPDAGRSMATNLGASAHIDEAAVDRAGIGDSAIVYLEGYLFDSPLALDAVRRAIERASASNTALAVTLSDPFVVDRHFDVLAELVGGPADVVFANEEEACRLAGAADVEAALSALAAPGRIVAVTRGAEGASLVAGGERVDVPAAAVEAVVDTTGAGDLFAAGVLYGVAHGATLEVAGLLGALAAGEVISHLGAPTRVVAAPARRRGGPSRLRLNAPDPRPGGGRPRAPGRRRSTRLRPRRARRAAGSRTRGRRGAPARTPPSGPARRSARPAWSGPPARRRRGRMLPW